VSAVAVATSCLSGTWGGRKWDCDSPIAALLRLAIFRRRAALNLDVAMLNPSVSAHYLQAIPSTGIGSERAVLWPIKTGS
jgi:hypothetical protein